MVQHGGEIIGRKALMADLALVLELPGITDRLIVDETHLPGYFNFDIQYAPGLNNPDQSSGSPSIFTAIQEQLGLKLEPARGSVEVLVIDSVSKPTED